MATDSTTLNTSVFDDKHKPNTPKRNMGVLKAFENDDNNNNRITNCDSDSEMEDGSNTKISLSRGKLYVPSMHDKPSLPAKPRTHTTIGVDGLTIGAVSVVGKLRVETDGKNDDETLSKLAAGESVAVSVSLGAGKVTLFDGKNVLSGTVNAAEKSVTCKSAFVFGSNGSVFKGSVVNGIPSGNGVKFSTHESFVHRGAFEAGTENGKGKRVYSNGVSLSGSFKDGNANGKIVVSENDTSYVTAFCNGVENVGKRKHKSDAVDCGDSDSDEDEAVVKKRIKTLEKKLLEMKELKDKKNDTNAEEDGDGDGDGDGDDDGYDKNGEDKNGDDKNGDADGASAMSMHKSKSRRP